MLLLPRERRKGRSCPRSQAKAVSTYENIPGILDKALRSTHSPGTNRAESLCFPAVRAKPYPGCMTQAEQPPDSPRRGYIAIASRLRSKYFAEVCRDSVLLVMPNTFGSGPKLRQGHLRRRSRFVK